MKLSEHFDTNEFVCPDCGVVHVHPDLIEMLENIRSHFEGRAIKVNSGYRCPHHNAEVGGGKYSQHMEGHAADIVVSGVSPDAVYAYCARHWPDTCGFGHYKTFTHVDCRRHQARWRG